jgi:hypothetical protein
MFEVVVSGLADGAPQAEVAGCTAAIKVAKRAPIQALNRIPASPIRSFCVANAYWKVASAVE